MTRERLERRAASTVAADVSSLSGVSLALGLLLGVLLLNLRGLLLLGHAGAG